MTGEIIGAILVLALIGTRGLRPIPENNREPGSLPLYLHEG